MKNFNIFKNLIFYFLIIILLSGCNDKEYFKEDGTSPGITIFYPTENKLLGTNFIISGKVWDKSGISNVTIFIISENNTTNIFFGVQDKVIYKSNIIHILPVYKCKINLYQKGKYNIIALAIDNSGFTNYSKVRHIFVDPEVHVENFKFFSIQHLAGIFSVLLFNILMVIILRKLKNDRINRIFEYFIALVLWIDEIILNLWLISVGYYRIGQNLIFHMCGLAVLFSPIMLIIKNEKIKYFMYEILFFWGFGGAIQALITPDIGQFNFPDFKYFTFFISHGFIITSITYMTFVKGYRPTWKSILKFFIVTNLMLIPISLINNLVKYLPPYEIGNYFFISYPPVDGSVIDILQEIFGPSPYYIIGLNILGVFISIILFLIIQIPFVFNKFKK